MRLAVFDDCVREEAATFAKYYSEVKKVIGLVKGHLGLLPHLDICLYQEPLLM